MKYSSNLQIETKLKEEINSALKNSESEISFEILAMTYLNQVLKKIEIQIKFVFVLFNMNFEILAQEPIINLISSCFKQLYDSMSLQLSLFLNFYNIIKKLF